MRESYDRRVVELVFAVGNSTSEKQARERVQQRIDVAYNYHFLPVLMQTRAQLLQWREAPPDVDQVVAQTVSVVRSILLDRPPQEIGLGGICTALIANNDYEDLVRDVKHFISWLDDSFFAEWDTMTRELEVRAFDQLVASARAQGDVIAFHALAPRLDRLMQALKDVPSVREGIEQIADTAQSTGRWIIRGCRTIELMARESGDTGSRPESDVILVRAIIQAREGFNAGGSREAIIEELLDDQNVKTFVKIQRALGRSTDSKEEITEVAARINPQFGAGVRFVLADSDEEARRILEDEPGMFSRQAEREFGESAELFDQQGRADLAERFRHAAARVHRWREELIDPQRNLVARLGASVVTKEFDLDHALVTLKRPGALAEVTVLHLGALDERVINLRDAADLRQAETLAVLNQAAAHAIGAPKIIAYTDLTLAELWSARGESAEKAIPLLKEADEIAEKMGDARMRARAVGTMGMVYQQSSRLQEALQVYLRSWEIGRDADLPDIEIAALDNLLAVYALIGDVEHAKEMADHAMESARKTNDQESEYKILAQLGTVLLKAGQADESIGYYEKALHIAREFGDLFVEANILSGLSQACTDAKHFGTAEDYARQALALARNSRNTRLEGNALSSLGLIRYRRGEMTEALRFFQDALQRMQQLGDTDGQAMMLNNIGRVELASGKYAEAEEHYRASIQKIEQVRLGLVGENERIAFMGFDRVYPYTGLTKLLALPQYLRTKEAWEIVERTRSRAFVEQLALIPLPAGTSIESNTSARERELISRVKAQTQILRLHSGTAGIDLQARRSAANALAEAQRELAKLWDTNTLPAEDLELRRGQPVAFSELQNLLIDKNQTSAKPVVLIEYFCTDDVTLIFGARADWDKPKMAEIKVPVLDIRRKTASFFGNDFDEHHTVIRPASEKIKNLDEDEWQVEFGKFIAPIREWANEGDIVWIVPHDALHYLPLHALKLDGRYLIERNPVVYAPSASVMKYCQLKRKGKHEHALVLGDSLGNLPHARDEARTVAAIFRSRAYLQSDATKRVVMEKLQAERNDVDVFHFACHGYFDQFQPLQSGIALAKNGGENPNLTAEDIFALEMHAELVVLSACESGVNQHKPGDELIGLTRALIYAGTPTVMVSLWGVRDDSTRVLMQVFYEEWLKPREVPITKAEALQCAQLAVMRMTVYDAYAKIEEFETHHEQNSAKSRAVPENSTNSVKSQIAPDDASRVFAKPYNWAPFVLVGDWK